MARTGDWRLETQDSISHWADLRLLPFFSQDEVSNSIDSPSAMITIGQIEKL